MPGNAQDPRPSNRARRRREQRHDPRRRQPLERPDRHAVDGPEHRRHRRRRHRRSRPGVRPPDRRRRLPGAARPRRDGPVRRLPRRTSTPGRAGRTSTWRSPRTTSRPTVSSRRTSGTSSRTGCSAAGRTTAWSASTASAAAPSKGAFAHGRRAAPARRDARASSTRATSGRPKSATGSSPGSMPGCRCPPGEGLRRVPPADRARRRAGHVPGRVQRARRRRGGRLQGAVHRHGARELRPEGRSDATRRPKDRVARDAARPKSFGGQLFGAVMQGKTGELYRAAASEARATGQGLRVTLSLTDVPELGGIPWEYLYDDPNFLSINAWTPVVRYLDLPKPRRALEIELPLRILGVDQRPARRRAARRRRSSEAKLEDALKPLTRRERGHDRLAGGADPAAHSPSGCDPTPITSSTSSATAASTTPTARAPCCSRTRPAAAGP